MKKYQNKKRGNALLISVLFFTVVSSAFIFGISTPILKQVKISKETFDSKKSYYTANGSLEDVVYRINNAKQVSSTETISLNGVYATTTTVDVSGGKEVTSSANFKDNIRKIKASLVSGDGFAFNYGIQTGLGGFELENSSYVTGNIYSSGPVTGSLNYIFGNVVSSGSSGLVDDIVSIGNTYAHTIRDSIIFGNAYYTTKTGTMVFGSSYPNNPDQPDMALPITDTDIEDFKTQALSGGTISSPCPYNITSTVTLGPKKINCDVNISSSADVTLNGNIWVSGNIVISNSAILRVSSSLSGQSIAIVADNPSNRSTGSTVDVKNTTQFIGSGTGSFIFLISKNTSASNGGSEEAVSMENSSSGSLVLYAPYGLVTIKNSASLKQVTAYKIKAKNSSNVVYSTGLSSVLFNSGPSGGFDITSVKEVE